ncbi:MAG: copper resistance protein NlpE N-terminal domain-containing protein [Flavobacteriaceae bacterium]|nr:copper resistance protein NlpE N-terminal domain-containing protein [Flavobacteriaceae bacterium]
MRIFLFTIMTFLILSCGSTTPTTSPHDNAHLAVHENYIKTQQQKLIKKQLAEKIKGVYIGKIPCADCSGIFYRIELFADQMYRTEMSYEGKSEEPFVESGEYSFDGDYLINIEPIRRAKIFKNRRPLFDFARHKGTGNYGRPR